MMNFRKEVLLPNGMIDCEIEHPKLGWVPYTCDKNAKSADMDIADLHARMSVTAKPRVYTPEDLVNLKIAARRNSVMPKTEFLSKLYDLGLVSADAAITIAKGDIPSDMSWVTDFMADSQKMTFMLEWAAFTELGRLNYIVLTIGSILNLSDEQLDSIFNVNTQG